MFSVNLNNCFKRDNTDSIAVYLRMCLIKINHKMKIITFGFLCFCFDSFNILFFLALAVDDIEIQIGYHKIFF